MEVVMKQVLLIFIFAFTLSCTELFENKQEDSERVVLDRREITILENYDMLTLYATAINEFGDTLTDASFNWRSSNENVVEINNGYVFGISPGVAEIRADYDGNISAPCVVTVLKQDSLFAVTNGNDVTIWHTRTVRGCSYSADMQVEITDNIITVTEVRVIGDGDALPCLCIYDFSVSVDDLVPGNYIAEVYVIDNPDYPENTGYYGDIEFTIEGNSNQTEPEVTDQFQSSCYEIEN